MAFGSFDRKTSSQPMAEINMVPLIDVVLVLLVIFIVTAPLLTNAVKLDLPKATSTADIQKPEKVEFAIDATGSLFWNGERISREDAVVRFTEVILVELGGGSAELLEPPLSLPPDAVERPVARRDHEPGGGVARHPAHRPGLDRRDEGGLHRLLGVVDVTEEADQGGQEPAVLLPERGLDGGSDFGQLNSRMGRISIAPQRAPGIFEARSIASSRSLQSSR